MKANTRLRSKLRLLIEQGRIPASQCGPSFRKFIASLEGTGVVKEVRAPSGRRLEVLNSEALRRFHDQHFPGQDMEEGISARVSGLAQYRDTKALKSDSPEIVPVRVLPASPVSIQGTSIDLADVTSRAGVASFLLDGTQGPELRGHWVLIENPALFFEHPRVFGEDTSAILVNGRMSNRMLDWLVGQPSSGLRLAHAPDYDPAGLNEFLRLYERLKERVTLFVPAAIDQLFERFSNRGLLLQGNQRSMLSGLRSSHHPEVSTICTLIDRFNAGLEQEALLLTQHLRGSSF